MIKIDLIENQRDGNTDLITVTFATSATNALLFFPQKSPEPSRVHVEWCHWRSMVQLAFCGVTGLPRSRIVRKSAGREEGET